MDWKKVKAEYITDESSSYRRLSDKYKIPLGTLTKRAKKENWVELKKQHGDRTVAKTVGAFEEKQVSKMKRIQDITDKLLDKLEDAVNELDLQLFKTVHKVKEIEYDNLDRPDKPTKEVIHEEETVSEVKTIVDRKGLQLVAAALKDIKEIQMLKSELDKREQEARIAKLQKEAMAEEKQDNEIKVTIEGGLEEYST